jgi:hypothetical protein
MGKESRSGSEMNISDHISEMNISDHISESFETFFGLKQGCGSGSGGFNQVSGSGSRRAKMTHKNRRKFKSSCFEVLDGLF